MAYFNFWNREDAEVVEIESLTREKIREWQIRRLDIKDQMQLHPEKTLELSRVLDLMDDEHAEILSGSKKNHLEGVTQREAFFARTGTPVSILQPVAGKFELQLHLTAGSPADLRILLEMAVYELQGCIDAKGNELAVEHNNYPGKMSGTLGSYEFELGFSGDSNE
ncbi:hypothetical protein ACQKFS_03135 [Pseudomonas guineae]|uniref:hypothetical protein n=1 Tax=Pseudomonas guineae TaxID=425504 RepID=UPI003CFFFDF7